MNQHKFFGKAAVILGAACLGAMTLAPKASAQTDSCPYGYYYVAGYGCAPLDYYSAPDILPFGLYGWGGWGYRGWNRGYYHGGTFHGGTFHGGGFFHGGGAFHGGHHR
ncbi:MAG TPA: hypothetical protein VGR70_01945 [Stellaceae bacterium]|nr:hypothetical protein [Stellaceae bacterium]